jgi:hypothetical protein
LLKYPDKTTILVEFCTEKAETTCDLVQQFGVASRAEITFLEAGVRRPLYRVSGGQEVSHFRRATPPSTDRGPWLSSQRFFSMSSGVRVHGPRVTPVQVQRLLKAVCRTSAVRRG